MYVLLFIYTTLYFGQPFDTLTIENMQYAVFTNESQCRDNLPQLSQRFKHKLLTEFQAVPLFMASCERAYVHNVDMSGLKFKVIERKVGNDEINGGS